MFFPGYRHVRLIGDIGSSAVTKVAAVMMMAMVVVVVFMILILVLLVVTTAMAGKLVVGVVVNAVGVGGDNGGAATSDHVATLVRHSVEPKTNSEHFILIVLLQWWNRYTKSWMMALLSYVLCLMLVLAAFFQTSVCDSK